MSVLDGPRIEARDGEADSLVVLLHGYGANGDDLIPLGTVWQLVLPHTVFVAPNAPEHLPFEAFAGRQWFPLTLRDPDEYWRGVSAAGPTLDRFLDDELARNKLPASRLVLVGFSQGTMMALHVAPRRREPLAGVIGYSGHLAGPEHLAAEMRGRFPVLLVHGSEDDVIPPAALHLAREHLAAAGLPVEWHLREGLDHGIDEEGLRLGGSFLMAVLGRKDV